MEREILIAAKKMRSTFGHLCNEAYQEVVQPVLDFLGSWNRKKSQRWLDAVERSLERK